MALWAQARWAQAHCRLGDPAAAEALGLQGLAVARAQGLPAAESRFLNMLEVNASYQSDLMATLNYSRQALQIALKLGDRRVEGVALSNLGNALWVVGELAQARRHAQDGLRLLQAIGNRQGQSTTLITLSDIALRQGDAALALTHARSALDIAVAVQSPDYQAQGWLRCGEAELALGRHAAAAAAFERARDMVLASGHPEYAIDGSSGLARVALAQGDVAQALTHVEPILVFVAQNGACGDDTGFTPGLTCWRVLDLAADPRAAETLRLVHSALQAKAATITDAALHHSYVNKLAENREIVAAWAAHGGVP